MSFVIAVAGARGASKSTVADFVCEYLPRTQQIAFATPIKRFVSQIFAFSYDQLYGSSEKRNRIDARYRHTVAERFNGQASHHWCDATQRYTQKRVEFASYLSLWSGQSFETVLSTLDAWWQTMWNAPSLSPRYVLQQFGTDMGRRLSANIWLNAMRALQPAGPCVITDARFDNEFKFVREQGGQLWHITRGARVDKHASEADVHGALLPQLRTAHYDNTSTLADLQSWVKATLDKQHNAHLTSLPWKHDTLHKIG